MTKENELKPLEGSEVMEKLASLELVDEFLEAVDSDDMVRIVALLKEIDLDDETIQSILDQIG